MLRRGLPWLICGLAAIFYFYEYLLRILPSVMAPELRAAFQTSDVLLGNLSAFYFYDYAPMQLVSGVVLDKYGPRRILTLAVLACTFGTMIFGLADHLLMACLGRFLIGFGSAFAFVGVLKLATIWLPPDRFAMISGLTTTLGMLGAIFGQNVLVRLVQEIGWADTILYSGIFGFILFPLIWFIVRDINPRTGAITKFSQISYCRVFKDVLKVALNRQIWINGAVGGLIMLPTTVFAELWGVSFLQVQHGFQASEATFGVSLIFGGWGVGSPIAAFISDKLSRRKAPLVIGSCLAFLIMLVILYVPSLPVWLLFTLLFLFGFVSSVEVICFAIARENSPFAVAATAVAFTNLLVVVAGFFQPLVGEILDWRWNGILDGANRVYHLSDYHWALIILPVSLFFSILFSFALKETHCHPMYPEQH